MIEIKDCRGSSYIRFASVREGTFFTDSKDALYLKLPIVMKNKEYYNCFHINAEKLSSMDCDVLVQPVDMQLNILSNRMV